MTGSGRHLAEIPALDGTLVMDETSLAAASDDCGHIVHRRPAAARLPAAGLRQVYESCDRERIVVDTAGAAPEESPAALLRALVTDRHA